MTERARKLRDQAEDSTQEAMNRWHETGELRHLYGQPLSLDDDPEWLVTKILKQNGISHPLIERGRELEVPREAADRIAQRLYRRRSRLAQQKARPTPEDIRAFNEWRIARLDEYRGKLSALNMAIRDFNLQAPDALQQRSVHIDEEVQRLSTAVPVLDFSAPDASPRHKVQPLWRARRRAP